MQGTYVRRPENRMADNLSMLSISIAAIDEDAVIGFNAKTFDEIITALREAGHLTVVAHAKAYAEREVSVLGLNIVGGDPYAD